MTVKTTLKVGSIIILITVTTVYLWYQVRRYSIAKNVSTINEAIADMNSPNNLFIETNTNEIDDATIRAVENDMYQYSNNGSDTIVSAVMIDGNVYHGDSITGVYVDDGGNVYNWNLDKLTYDGSEYYINPLSVKYGILNQDNVFTELT